MKQLLLSLSLRTLAVLPFLLLAGTVEAGNRRPGGIIIIINNDPLPIVSHLEPPPPAPPAPKAARVKVPVAKSGS